MEWYNDKVYQLMCKTATEIQKIWDSKKGDFYGDPYWDNKQQENLYTISVLEDDNRYLYQPRFTWFPCQNRLQNMMWLPEREGIEKATDAEVRGCFWDLMKEVFDCLKWYDDECYDYNHFTSMEQLWLAFVMKEKFNKIWNGNNWLKNG